MSAADGLFGVVMLLVMWGTCLCGLRIVGWVMDYLERRDQAAFREQVMLAEAEIARRSNRREFDGERDHA